MSFAVNTHMLIAAVIFIIFDIVTGVMAALLTGTFKSSVMRKGGARKLFLVIVLGFGVALDYVQTIIDIGIKAPAVTLIGGYICLMEIMSCIENINKAYPNALPKKLISMLNTGATSYGVEVDNTDKKE